MKSIERKIIKIGNSFGLRLSKSEMDKYGLKMNSIVLIEEGPYSITIRKPQSPHKLSIEESARAAANSAESWDDFEGTTHDGLKNF